MLSKNFVPSHVKETYKSKIYSAEITKWSIFWRDYYFSIIWNFTFKCTAYTEYCYYCLFYLLNKLVNLIVKSRLTHFAFYSLYLNTTSRNIFTVSKVNLILKDWNPPYVCIKSMMKLQVYSFSTYKADFSTFWLWREKKKPPILTKA